MLPVAAENRSITMIEAAQSFDEGKQIFPTRVILPKHP